MTSLCYYDDLDSEPTCPECGAYNACLLDHETMHAWWKNPSATAEARGDAPTFAPPDYRKCRDCGAKSIRVIAED